MEAVASAGIWSVSIVKEMDVKSLSVTVSKNMNDMYHLELLSKSSIPLLLVLRMVNVLPRGTAFLKKRDLAHQLEGQLVDSNGITRRKILISLMVVPAEGQSLSDEGNMRPGEPLQGRV